MRPINDLCKETSHGDDDCGDQGSPQPQQKLVPIKTTLGGSLVCSFVRSLETEFVYWEWPPEIKEQHSSSLGEQQKA